MIIKNVIKPLFKPSCIFYLNDLHDTDLSRYHGYSKNIYLKRAYQGDTSLCTDILHDFLAACLQVRPKEISNNMSAYSIAISSTLMVISHNGNMFLN